MSRSVPFYHYTNGPGLDGILKEGRLGVSDPKRGDAVEGRGTYGTNLVPSTRPKAIAENNWDSGWKTAMEHGKMDHYIRCEIPKEELKDRPGHGQRKDGRIFVHREGIDLRKYPTRYGQVGKDTVPQAKRYDPESIRRAIYPDRRGPAPPPPRAPLPPSPARAVLPSAGITKQAPTGLSRSSQSTREAISAAFGHDLGEATTWNSGPQLQSSGYNSRGNYYESYDDGSYHYENQDGSTYQCDADGHTAYTTPGGWVVESEGSDDEECAVAGFAVPVEDSDDEECAVAGYAVEAEDSHSDGGGGYGGGDDYEDDYGDYGGGSDYGDDYDDDYDDDY
ncbi:nek2 [Symbiodinium sp. CCMP2592]|nr:nek2 [Symbiodinium sp. CCMP2592]